MFYQIWLITFVVSPFFTLATSWHIGKNLRFSSIQSTIKLASPYDTVYIHEGEYKEGNITIHKPLVMHGINHPVINGELKYEPFSVKSNEVTIDGFTIINTGYSSMEDIAAIRMYGVHHVTISNNIIINSFFGIYFTNATYCKVINNQLHGPVREQHHVGNGIHFWKSSFNSILGNRISHHRDGIYFEFVKNTLIANNHSEINLRYGLHFMFSDSDNYYSNAFINNGSGVAVMYSKQVNMLQNRFVHNWGGAAYGLLLKDIRDSYVINNVFEENTTGIHAEGCSRSLIFANTFSKNGYAIKLQANCDDNRISFNNFFINTFDIVTNGFTVLNEIKYNYWDKYNGYDLQRDGIGDQFYRPMSLFSAVTETSPVTIIFIKSFLADLLDTLEKLIPGLTPENLKDDKPLINPFTLAAN